MRFRFLEKGGGMENEIFQASNSFSELFIHGSKLHKDITWQIKYTRIGMVEENLIRQQETCVLVPV